MNVVLPELDGRLLTRAISFKAETAVDPRLEYASVRHAPDADRVDYVARLASSWARLARRPRAERRLALILSDYPARWRTGYAVPRYAASAEEILRLLKTEGYATGVDSGSVDAFLRRATDHIEIPLATYRSWLKALPENLQRSLQETWSEPAGAFRFPVLRCGNVLVLLQPDRGAPNDRKRDDRKSGYHDMNCPPSHSYVALYAWLREVERIDALIHLGTHGTLEGLPGKALALMRSAGRRCWARCR
jgi:cobaltochelatase CobN